ncbi:MAG: helix-turn-helix transcriptional regulator [Desulfobacterales bacterium]|nr:MAG: helix-turn-helix transcriptional regulator [Desulfobacterales bacterium]
MLNNQTKKIDEIADIFKALSNPNRLRIFQQLASCCKPGTKSIIDARSTAYVGELGEQLDIVPSTVSHHIKELKRSGLIRTNRKGQKIECWVDPETIEMVRGFFSF